MSAERQEVEALAALLAECPHIYTVNDYGAVGPGEESAAAYGMSGGVAEWLRARGVRMPGSPDQPMRIICTACGGGHSHRPGCPHGATPSAPAGPWQVEPDEHGESRYGWSFREFVPPTGRAIWIDRSDLSEAEAIAVRDALNRVAARVHREEAPRE